MGRPRAQPSPDRSDCCVPRQCGQVLLRNHLPLLLLLFSLGPLRPGRAAGVGAAEQPAGGGQQAPRPLRLCVLYYRPDTQEAAGFEQKACRSWV